MAAAASFASPFSGSMMDAFEKEDSNNEEDDDFTLEDAGFFGSFNAQKALNELGLQPSPPKARRYGDHDEDDDMPFDLDQELDMEEEQAKEEMEVPEGLEDDIDDVLESTGLLHRSSTLTNAITPQSTQQISPPVQVLKEPSPEKELQPIASTSHLSASIVRPPDRSPIVEEETQEELGINGLPKYIPAGVGTATLLDGSMIRFEKKRRMKGWKPRPAHYGTGSTGLLSQPVHQIVDKIEAMRALKVVIDEETREQPVRPKKTKQMWQERYRPQRFTELIGEERTHRDVLRWLKEWDACVFGKKAHLRKKWKKEGEDNVGFVYSDKWSRPRERILLLGGRAGMGKTTLAHVAAKQCGYLIHELNASDDRSARTVEDRVREALECKSLKQETNLPTCLVLDEVDGATGGKGEEGGGFIKALIKLVEKGSGVGGKKGAKKHRPLLRPIICICNDPYSPNLRALRPYAKMIQLSRPSTPLLTNRLKYICELEGIPNDSKGLNTLVDICQGDIRSCLNVLQLIQAGNGGLTAETFKEAEGDGHTADTVASNLGIKDGNCSIHQVWSQLFRTMTTREKAQKRGHNRETKSDAKEGASIVGSIMNSGEMDKILGGCFEHYPTLKLVDDGWWRFKKMHDWIYWYESINKRSWEVGAQNEMWTYLPWSFVGWKHLFANTGNPLPEYPRVDYQNHLKRSAFDEVTADLIGCLPASTRSQFNALSTITELGPSLINLLSPDLKLINSQLVRSTERSTLTSIVEIMQHCNLNFIMDKNDQGQSFYRFEPPLEVFVQFEGKKSSFVGPAKFQLRQMIVAELNTARLKARRLQMGKDVEVTSRAQDSKGYKDAYAKGLGGRAEVRNGAESVSRIAVDFFGRPIVSKAVEQIQPVVLPALPDSILGRRKQKESEDEVHQSTIKKSKLKVFYNYHEGYSNAVRKPVKMSSLLM